MPIGHATARTLVAVVSVLLVPIGVRADKRAIDREQSTLTIFVDKGGIFSAFADNHVIRAPIATGVVNPEGTPGTEITVNAADMIVVDPSLSAVKCADVTARMIGPEVLDSARYPEIRFSSVDIKPDGIDRWQMTGTLLLHGVSRSVTGGVAFRDGHYRGRLPLRQSDFGIRPISIAGGTVRVKDAVRIDFDIVVNSR